MTICFKDYRGYLEETGLSEMDALMRTLEEGDKVCMAEEDHDGEHTFVNEDEVELVYSGQGDEPKGTMLSGVN